MIAEDYRRYGRLLSLMTSCALIAPRGLNSPQGATEGHAAARHPIAAPLHQDRGSPAAARTRAKVAQPLRVH
jgi:hypothetical protein